MRIECACGATVEVTAEQLFYMTKGDCPGEGASTQQANTRAES